MSWTPMTKFAERANVLRCLSLADGREIWRFNYSGQVKRNHGVSRTIPAVTEQYVVALGPSAISFAAMLSPVN